MLKKELKKYLSELFARYFPNIDQKKFSKRLEKIVNEIFVSERAFKNFKRICENDYYQSAYSESFESFLIYLEVILKISAFSNYLIDIVVRNPQFLTRFLSRDELQKNFSYEDYSNELKSQLQIFKSFEKKIEAVRRFKRMHILRIGLRDILRLCDIEQSMLEYSNLTRTILENVFELALQANKEKSKLKSIPDYALISLGKFGGNELNYSSDVDLICVYDNPEEKVSSSVLEFYDRVVKDFIQICSELKDGSSLYRIDSRLRPDGKYSPLARSISYYQVYYETYGRDWERQMLLKMNFCAGSKNLFDRFFAMLQNFIYPRTFFEPPQYFVQKFREIQKENFDEEILSKNLKHFSGGIRDVEFSVQVLQMLYGGKIKELRTPNTIEAIQKLEEKNLIKSKTAKELIEAYKFLRKIENFIQLMDDRQTHLIPEDEDKFQNLIRFSGFNSKTEFNQKLNHTRKIITEFHKQVFETKKETTKQNFENKRLQDTSILNKLNFIKSFIRESVKSHSVWIDESSLKNFEKILTEYVESSQNPENFITNLFKFFKQVKTSNQVIEIVKNLSLTKLLFEILENSDLLSNKLISNPFIFDYFFSGRIFNIINIEEYFNTFDNNEIERFLFSLMINYFNQTLTPDEIGNLIAEFLDRLIKYIVSQNEKSSKIKNEDFVLIGLGSYGTNEMHFMSDIDLLFVFKPDIDFKAAEYFSRKVLNDIQERFKLYNFFNADSRLRPEGTISKLSWKTDELEKYINERMRIWEFQSYTKMRMITGNKNLFDDLNSKLKFKIGSLNKNLIASEIKKNKELIRRQKIQTNADDIDLKNSNGGLMDIQFTIQYLMIKEPEKYFITGKNTQEIIRLFSREFDEFKASFKLIQKNYEMMKSFILYQQILFGGKGFLLNNKIRSRFLEKIFKVKKPQNIFELFRSILKQNYEFLTQICPEIF